MRAVQVVRHGAPEEAVAVVDVPVPEPGPGQVRVKVSAASVNFGDIARARGGVASVMAQPPFTLGMDVCGTVDAVGEGVDPGLRAPGSRVVAVTAMAMGGMAEYALAPVHQVFDAPPSFDDAEAAGFLLPYHVAHLALHRRARIQPGEHLLVVGGATGVGSAAIELGELAGAHVVAVAGGADKTGWCRARGAGATVDHTVEDLFDAVMEATGGHGADVALDMVGGSGTEAVWTCMACEGRYVAVGFNDDPDSGLTGRPLRKVSTGNFSVLGLMMSYHDVPLVVRRLGLNPFPPSVGAEVHAALLGLAADGRLHPAVERRITMDEVGAALAAHEQRRTFGRTVVMIGAS